ncbi:HNH endonuclease signature motif containing protein [Butyrivibrio sp. WCD2001]|uniref:HNH endonuclease signature motif containing protein n=1 Tax=Butyrivibrio sp. WCD2001 TaxID=1280681 RepID=UPI00042090B4|nr:HNH endonuclease signature motif containing protein [Butyrivibrio sp. WCD2001]
MDSLNEIRKKIPMPTHCPFCGELLTPDNAELDHIIPPRLGGKTEEKNMRYLCRECNRRKANKYNVIFEYYYRLMQNKGMTDESLGKKIDYALRDMSVEDMDNLEKRLESKDPSFKRLFAYYKALSSYFNKDLPQEAQPQNDEIAEKMASVIKAYDNYDIDSEERVEINGNIFKYKKDFPIDQYKEILAEYGEEEQDEVYSVYLDEEGRLVVY